MIRYISIPSRWSHSCRIIGFLTQKECVSYDWFYHDEIISHQSPVNAPAEKLNIEKDVICIFTDHAFIFS